VQGILRFGRHGGLAAVALACLLGAPTLSGCSWLHFGKDDEAYDYRKAQPRQEPLEVPPDLSQFPKDDRYNLPGTASAPKPAATASNAAKPGDATAAASNQAADANAPKAAAPAGAEVAPTVVGARIVRDGNQSWLAVDTTPEVAYATVKDMWVSMGYKIAKDEPRLGVLETDWAYEHPVMDQGLIRNALQKFLGSVYTTGERHQYRALIERMPNNTAEITINQRGMEEIYTTPTREQTKWQWVPSRPDLEVEMLQRVALRFSAAPPAQVAAAAPANAARASDASPAAPAAAAVTTAAVATSNTDARVHKVTVGGVVTLQVEDSLDHTWRRVGIALDRSGFTIEDRVRDKSTYTVRYLDPEYEAAEREKRSWWDRVFNSDAKIPEQQFRIVMSANGTTTAVEVQDHDGKVDTSPTAGRILDQIMEQLR